MSYVLLQPLTDFKNSKLDDQEWTGNVTFVTRKDWNAQTPKEIPELLSVIPPKMVVIAHTAGRVCPDGEQSCKDFMRLIQNANFALGWNDIAYNFLVGGDGVVFAGTGWNREGTHSLRYNNKSIAIAFVGNYDVVEPTPELIAAGEAVITVGLSLGKIDPDFYVVLQSQLRPFSSPGLYIRKIVKTEWPWWSPIGDIDVIDSMNFTQRFYNRSSWFASEPTSPLPKQRTPLHSVLVYHTENFNVSIRNTLMSMMELQIHYKTLGYIDVPSNFIIFTDGCIYEGRGWDSMGEGITNRSDDSLKSTLRIELVTSGTNSSQKLIPEMNISLKLLLEESVKLEKLVSNYKMYEYDSYAKYRRWIKPFDAIDSVL